jgi:class 3 adenylate cyclase
MPRRWWRKEAIGPRREKPGGCCSAIECAAKSLDAPLSSAVISWYALLTMDREVRYCTTEDGVRIAYSMEGAGPPLIVCPFFFEAFSFDAMVPEFASFMKELGKGRTLIRYDQRGCGLSQPPPEDLSVPAQMLDLLAVVESSGLAPVTVLAGTLAGPRAIMLAASRPELVDALILYGTYARPADVMPWENTQALAMLSRANWQVASQTFSDMAGRADFPETMARFAEYYQQSVSGDVVARTLEVSYQTDVSDLLPRVSCPTLVLHRPKDTIFPVQAGQVMAAAIPEARMVPLPGTGHHIAMGESQAVLRAIDSLLASLRATPRDVGLAAEAAQQATVRTVLFTDLVGHTAMMRRLGDERGRAVLREHERITREVLRAHAGAEVKTMGDGFMASFGSVTKAVECGIALQRAFAERNEGAEEPLAVRVGLNAGEPIEEDGDLFGETVILAARIAAMAQGGEVLASLAVRELCAGKGFAFADLGEHAMRGFEDPVRVFEVSWRG